MRYSGLVWIACGITGAAASYYASIWMIDRLRTGAGVGSDTATVVDALAWLGSIGVTSATTGSIARLLRHKVGRSGVVLVGLAFVLTAATHPVTADLMTSDGLLPLVFGSRLPVGLGLMVVAGYASGWRITDNRCGRPAIWMPFAIFVAALVGYWATIETADAYLLRVYG